MSLLGSLSDTKLADVLQLFAAGRKSGRLGVSAGGSQAVLGFHQGTIVHASSGPLRGNEAVLDLFGWKEGELSYVLDESLLAPNVTKGVEALVREGTERGAALHRIHQLIPTDQVVFEPTPGPPDDRPRYTIGKMEWQVIRWVDGVRNVRDVVEASRVSRAEVQRILCEMTDAGFLRAVDLNRTLRAQVQLPFPNFSLIVPSTRTDNVAEVDVRLDEEWRRAARFARGVERVKVRSLAGKSLILAVAFRPGLGRDICLSRTALVRLAVREGNDVGVRPAGSRLGEKRP
jgi:hypothetical protein